MNVHDLPIAQLKAELFKSLGHPLRVRALEQLVHGERSVSALADALDIEITQLSQQLAVLRRAGVVVTRRDGNSIFYSLRDPHLADLLSLSRRMLVENLRDSSALLNSLEAEPSNVTETSTIKRAR